MKQVTKHKVKVCDDGRKRWIVTHCDDDSSIVGDIAVFGLPAKAENLPVGSTFETIFTWE